MAEIHDHITFHLENLALQYSREADMELSFQGLLLCLEMTQGPDHDDPNLEHEKPEVWEHNLEYASSPG